MLSAPSIGRLENAKRDCCMVAYAIKIEAIHNKWVGCSKFSISETPFFCHARGKKTNYSCRGLMIGAAGIQGDFRPEPSPGESTQRNTASEAVPPGISLRSREKHLAYVPTYLLFHCPRTWGCLGLYYINWRFLFLGKSYKLDQVAYVDVSEIITPRRTPHPQVDPPRQVGYGRSPISHLKHSSPAGTSIVARPRRHCYSAYLITLSGHCAITARGRFMGTRFCWASSSHVRNNPRSFTEMATYSNGPCGGAILDIVHHVFKSQLHIVGSFRCVKYKSFGSQEYTCKLHDRVIYLYIWTIW